MVYLAKMISLTKAKNLLKCWWLPIVLGLPLFFCLHHYEGIIGDARLYLLQVMHSWQPERFVDDPPFMFGNQDSYGLFTFFYSAVVKYFPIDSGTLVFTFLGQLMWFVSAYYFIMQFVKKYGLRLWFLPVFLFLIFDP